MTILQAGKVLSGELNKIYNEREAANIAAMVLENITTFSATQRLIHKEERLTQLQQHQLQSFTEQLLQHKPIQYVLREAWFAGLKFYVDENVLIPRPETEELVETVIQEIKRSQHENVNILDVGTGSGCIPITIKKKLPFTNVYALDISKKALAVAERNAADNKTEIEFIYADMLNIQPGENLPLFDIIISNPPYIKQSESKTMQPNVLQYEPHNALFVPDTDALIFYKAIAGFSLQNLNTLNGKLFFEINEKMGTAVAGLLQQEGFAQITIKKDLQHKERIVTAILNKTGKA